MNLEQQIAEAVHLRGGRTFLIGGAVRDQILGVSCKDIDLEVFGIPEGDLRALLESTASNVLRVGKFPVWKVWGKDNTQADAIDVALPRLETKTGEKHTDFEVVFDPTMTFEEAALRRDFTMNAIGVDIMTHKVHDPYNGIGDIKNRVLRHTSRHFAEDPLRVLRAMQFAARFELTVAPETVELCRTLSMEYISKERVFTEFAKLILKGRKPSLGLNFLKECGWLEFFPELKALIGVRQDPDWHPEGDVWTHTLHCLDAFATRRTGDDQEDLIVGFAVLGHDFGKPTTTVQNENLRWIAPGHEGVGEGPVRAFLGRMTDETELIQAVIPLVTNHMTPKLLHKDVLAGNTNKDKAVRRLAVRVRLDRLARVCWADSAGRPPKPQVAPDAEWLLETAAALQVEKKAPVKLLMGRHLIYLGCKPSPDFKEILEAAFEKQLDGEITTKEEALQFAKNFIMTKATILTPPKQVLVIRADLKMGKGKMSAQAAHASMAAILSRGHKTETEIAIDLKNDPELKAWLDGLFTKVCLAVHSEAEMLEIHCKAVAENLRVGLIKDSGLTQFHGVPTYTVLAIGPHIPSKFVGLTDTLKLIPN